MTTNLLAMVMNITLQDPWDDLCQGVVMSRSFSFLFFSKSASPSAVFVEGNPEDSDHLRRVKPPFTESQMMDTWRHR